MKCAIMQPYIFPYIGYFQMINAVDHFVFYDDVNYIKGGWINRNRIIGSNGEIMFTFPLLKASPNKLINEIKIDTENKNFKNLLTTVSQAYKKAPYFAETFPIIENIFIYSDKNLAKFAINGLIEICKYLEIKTEFYISSEKFSETKGIDKADRIIEVSKKLNCNEYINAIGGVELYQKEYFAKHGIQLSFIQSEKTEYPQFSENFIPWLSIIDVLMFNSVEEVHGMLDNFELL